MVRLWDARTGEAVGRPLDGHSDSVQTVTFSPDGSTLGSGAQDGTIRFWRCSVRGPEDKSRLPSSRSLTDQSSLPIPQRLPSLNLPPREALRLKDNGWIVGPNDELILWLPLGLRVKMPFSEWAGIDNIDFTTFKCGAEWADCWQGSGEAQAA